MNQYLIPANSKKSQLIFNLFRPVDLFVIGGGALLTLILMFALPGDEIHILVIKLLPLAISLLLVVPIPQYHNVLVFLREMLLYMYSEKEYVWKGWCASSDNYDKKVR